MKGIAIGLLLVCATFTSAQSSIDFNAPLETLRAKYNLPSISGVAVQGDHVFGVAAVGTLGSSSKTPVTLDSAYQLGSISKSVNATMIARLVERGLLRWDSTLGEVLKDVGIPAEYANVTLEQLLTHRSGITPSVSGSPSGTTLAQQRVSYLQMALKVPRAAQVFNYSNLGFIAAAMMAERVTGKSWKTLIRKEVFQPLGMMGCGFGFAAKNDPLPHVFTISGVQELPRASGNPAVFDGADQIRCPLQAFGRFMSAHLVGEKGGSGLLKLETWKYLHTDPFGNEYAFGWFLLSRPWANGRVLVHDGSNTVNYAVMWLAPERGIAMMIAIDVGYDQNNSIDHNICLGCFHNRVVHYLIRLNYFVEPRASTNCIAYKNYCKCKTTSSSAQMHLNLHRTCSLIIPPLAYHLFYL